MTIPTEAEFKELIAFASHNRPMFAYPPEKWLQTKPTKAELHRVIDILNRSIDEMVDAKAQLVASKWLEGQLIVKKAHDSAFKTRSRSRRSKGDVKLREADWIEEDTDYFFDIFCSTEDSKEVFFRIDRHFNAAWQEPRWPDYLASILIEYFHTNHAEQSIALRAKIEAQTHKTKNAINDFIALQNELAEIDGPDPSKPNRKHSTATTLTFDRAISQLDRGMFIPQWLIFPLQRKDPHLREQLLVYRFWQAHQRTKRFPASCVADLMYLEGIEHPYDVRTIERLYAKFTGTKTPRNENSRRDIV